MLFIATANNIANINPALRDRMEMINIPGYILEDKIQIALHHLLPKQREAHGIKEQELILTPQIVEQIIAGYTRESGVRSLDKHIAKLARSRAKQIASEEAFAPELGAKEVEKILGDTDDPATFYPGSKHILFTIGDATLVCRILEGEFLDWRRVLPQNNPVKLVGNVSRLTDSIERVGLVISEKLKSPVRCKFGDNAAELRTVSTIGEAYDVCPIAGDGKDLEIGFNCKYLLDALRAVPDSECTLEMINGLSPIVLNPTEGNRYSYMVLPVRLKAGE